MVARRKIKMSDITIGLDDKSKMPLYEQIYTYIKNEIQLEHLRCAEKLPSTRALALHLEVSRSTVDLAYEQLRLEGYIEAIPCKGFFVAEIRDLHIFDSVQEKGTKPKTKKEKSYLYDFTPYGVDLKSFPHNTWRKLAKEILIDDRAELFRLGDSKGEYELREAIANYLYQSRGATCRPEQIVIGAGSDYMILLLHILLGNKMRVAFENPTYTKAYNIFKQLNYEMCTVPTNVDGIDIASLYKINADLAYVMPSHQYPLGTIMPLKRRLALLDWAKEREGRYIVEDDYDSEFRYKGKPIPALQGYDKYEKVIYLGTFSKAIAPAIRISYMVLPEPLLKAFETRGKILSSSVSKVDQMILSRFISNRHFERHLNKTRALYKSRHDMLMQCLKPLLSVCEISGEHGGVHLLLTFHNGKTEKELIATAKEVQIRIYGLSEYYVNEMKMTQKKATILLGYANMNEEDIKIACNHLISIWK